MNSRLPARDPPARRAPAVSTDWRRHSVAVAERPLVEPLPAVMAALPQLTGRDRIHAEASPRRRAEELRREVPELGWQSWNLARDNAIEALLRGGYLVPGN